jgi:hypothetical protein
MGAGSADRLPQVRLNALLRPLRDFLQRLHRLLRRALRRSHGVGGAAESGGGMLPDSALPGFLRCLCQLLPLCRGRDAN